MFQPDYRIRTRDLGVITLRNNEVVKRFVTHDRVGCPRNAVVEQFNGFLRCWACRTPLNEEAAEYVRRHAHTQGPNDGDGFMWNDGFYHRRPAARK